MFLKNTIFNVTKCFPKFHMLQSSCQGIEKNHFNTRSFQTLINSANPNNFTKAPTLNPCSRLLQNKKLPAVDQIRTTTYELKQWRENRVINRYFRLNWGGWIRTRGGRFKSLYRKTAAERWRLRKHIFLTRKQSALMDKMVTPGWRKPKYYVDQGMEIYQPYQTRTQSYHHPNHKKFFP